MSVEATTLEALASELAALRQEVAELRKEIKRNEPIDPETLQVLGAAVAAYLGKQARIRIVRRVNPDESDAWKVQGRVTVAGRSQMTQMMGRS